MLNGHIHQEIIRPSGQACIQFRPHAPDITFDLRLGGPVAGLIRWQPAVDWIDAEGEEAIEAGVKRLQSGKLGMQKIPIERLQMAEVKNNAVAFGDRAVID